MWFLSTVIFPLLLVPAAALLQNVAILKGQSLTYSCDMPLNSWHFIRSGTNVEKIIYNDKGFNEEYGKRAQVANSSEFNSSLTIPSIQLDDAGIYGCKTLLNSTVTNERAQVIVIESNLKICHAEESQQLICEVMYKGNFGPVIEWTNDDSSGLSEINSTLRNDSGENGTRHLTLVTNSVNSTLSCKLYFKDFSSHSEKMATNIPTYTDQKNSSDDCSLSSGTTITGLAPDVGGSANPDSSRYTLLSATIGSFSFILTIVVIGLILEKKKVLKRKKFKPKKKRRGPMELPAPGYPDIVQSDDISNVIIEEVPQSSLPVYALIISEESDYLSPDESQTTNQNRFVAPDGTEYMIMNTTIADDGRPSTGIAAIAPVSSVFSSMEYASIDHTLQSHCQQPQPPSPAPRTPSKGLYRHITPSQPPIPSPRNLSRKR